MDNIIQIAKIRGERRLFHVLWITALEKVKTWNHKGHCMLFYSFVFFFKSSPPKLFWRVAALKFRKFPWKTFGGFLLLLQDIDLHIYRNWIAQHIVLGILKQLFFQISSIDFCTSFVSSIIIFQIYTESLLHVQLSLLHTQPFLAVYHLPFFKIFSNFVHFCPNFQICCSFLPLFNIVFPFFRKIGRMPLLSRIGPDVAYFA